MSSKTEYNPYRSAFPRAKFIQLLEMDGNPAFHRLRRSFYVEYFRSKNPKGYHHDLGAQDVFLDNLGMFSMEQFASDSEFKIYEAAIDHCLVCWGFLKTQVVQRQPWWGIHFNSISRQANAGEPRSLLRFMGAGDWSDPYSALSLDYLPNSLEDAKLGDPSSFEADPRGETSLDEQWINPWEKFIHHRGLTSSSRDWDIFHDWNGDALVPEDWDWNASESANNSNPAPNHYAFGVELPESWGKRVDKFLVLHPDQSTPDLPLRVGDSKSDLNLYAKLVQDQGNHPTCAANAISVGLDILADRSRVKFKSGFRFSRAWIHCASAGESQDWNSGRHLSAAVEAIRKELPCSEAEFNYPNSPLNPAEFRGWRTPSREQSSVELKKLCPPLLIRKVEPREIAEIKTFLAAGWLVVLSTSLTREFLDGSLNKYGSPLVPLMGQARLSQGHAWLLVGYNHVDGQNQWKYQGHFRAINSWGSKWPTKKLQSPGQCHLPFTMLLTEGIEAYAIRFE
jgi:hypothetical protein